MLLSGAGFFERFEVAVVDFLFPGESVPGGGTVGVVPALVIDLVVILSAMLK